ncbi:FHA domain-containing protein [Apiospora marii]|uniref:FHA domain-containing protein n=1 Tax=Apiospora marii TaxID=335849 RepID=A0ABR1REY6_9PEZI
MTAVASPPTLVQHNRPAWGMNGHGGQTLNQMNPEELNRMFLPRKNIQRTNSSSSLSSNASNSSTSTVVGPNTQQPSQSNAANGGASMSAAGDLSSWPNATAARKRPQGKAPWPSSKPEGQSDFSAARLAARPQMMPGNANGGPVGGGLNGTSSMHSPSPILQSQGQMASQSGMPRPMTEGAPSGGQPVLYLLSLNGTFERKTISVPFSPDTLRIGRQTNAKTVPTPINGFFDSKVLSRQHAEIWADRQGKIWIRDVKSSNGTFVNGTRLSQENRESEPHELQTGDHLELGIDIVSEDQKTVVHHKVAAKVEHSGFLNASNNLLDMNFGDLDPANGSMMMQPVGGMPYRGRNGSQASMANNGRMMPAGGMMAAPPNGMAHQRGGFFFSPISTEQIVKRLQSEMRTARLQTQDLGRTSQFISTLLSHDDIKDMEQRLEPAEPPRLQMSNGGGNAMPFLRNDNKARFSDPPAPPPQQPLPEKPDVPSLKRGTTERPKVPTPNPGASPIRQDGNVSQILQLTEALNVARKEIESQTSRMKDLEEMLHHERQARELAEELAKRLEDAAAAKVNGAPVKPEEDQSTLEQAFEPPVEILSSPDVETPTGESDAKPLPPQVDAVEASATHLHNQLESMVSEIKDLKQQLDTFKQRAEVAEKERDADRQSLAEMALQIRKDAEAREILAREKSRSRSNSQEMHKFETGSVASDESTLIRTPSTSSSGGQVTPGGSSEPPTLSRANTITPSSSQTGGLSREQVLAHGLPYTSMIGVVLLGMGLMAYINGWQPQPSRLEQ